MSKDMETLGKWFADAAKAKGQPILAVCINNFRTYNNPPETLRRLLTAKEWLNDPWFAKEFDNDFGGAECPPAIAWTADWLFAVSEYDGSTALCILPRNPTGDVDFYYAG